MYWLLLPFIGNRKTKFGEGDCMEGSIKRQRESIIKQDWILQQLSMDQEMWRRGGYSHIYTSGPTRSIPFTWWEKLPVIIIMHLDVCTYFKFVSKLVLFCGISWSKSHLWSIMVARDLMKVSIICLMFPQAKAHLKCNKQFWSQSYNFQAVFYLCPTMQFWSWWYNPQVFLLVILLLPKGPRDATKLWPSCNTHQEDLPWCNKNEW